MKKALIIISVILVMLLIAGGFYYFIKTKKITPSAQTVPPAISLTPATGTYQIGDTISVDYNADTGGKTIDGIDVNYLNYDPKVLQALTVTQGNISQLSTFGNTIDSTNGKIQIWAVVPVGSSGYSGSGKVATLTFKVLANTSSTKLTFDFNASLPSRNDCNMFEHGTSDSQGYAIDVLQEAKGANYTIGTIVPLEPKVDLKVDGSNGPVTKNQGETAQLSWTVSNAASCVASGGWSKAISPSNGSETVGPLQTSKSYILTCKNSAQVAASDTVVINVKAPDNNPPSVDLKANDSDGPVEISSGQTVKLSWTSTGANSCTASGDWSGDKSVSGEETTGALDSAKNYSLTCNNSDGETADAVSINVTAATGGSDDPAVEPDENQASETNNESPDPVVINDTEPQPVNDTSMLSPSTNKISKLPSNIQPQTTPTATEKPLEIYKNEAMKPWALWFLYAVIPAFLAGLAIYYFLKRRKTSNNNTEII